MVNGKEVPILQPEVHVELINKKTGKDYESLREFLDEFKLIQTKIKNYTYGIRSTI